MRHGRVKGRGSKTRRLLAYLLAMGTAIALAAISVQAVLGASTGAESQSAIKQAILDQRERHLQEALHAPRLSKGAPQPPPPVAEAPWRTGILPPGEPPPFPAVAFVGENAWQELVGGERVTVYAGSEGSGGDVQRGLVAVWSTSADGKDRVVEYRTPVREGAVRIAAANGYRLTLVTRAGTVLVFDVSTRQFLSS